MSSPTYDEQIDLSQDDLEAFDKIEHTLSHFRSQHSNQTPRLRSQNSPSKVTFNRVSQDTNLSARERRQKAIAEALRGCPLDGIGKENLHASDRCGEEK